MILQKMEEGGVGLEDLQRFTADDYTDFGFPMIVRKRVEALLQERDQGQACPIA